MRLLKRLAIAAVTVAATLAITPAGASAAVDQTSGVDYSWYRPSAAQLGNIGFAARYLVPQAWGSGKALTAAEASALRAQGRTVVLNYEWDATAAAGGYWAGVRDAQNAEVARVEVGAPALVIYFSVDYDTHCPACVVSYLSGVAAVIGRARVGVYGGYLAVKASLDAGFPFAWQTYAWSYGRWDSRAQLRQVANGYYWRGQGDRDVAVSPNYGGWVGGPTSYTPGDDLRPTPRYVTKAPARPVAGSVYYVRPGDTLSGIAATFGTTYAALARLNGIDNPNRIYPGQRLVLPGAAPVARFGSAYYTIRRGDTLGGIAARYGTTVYALQRINAIRNPNVIYAGRAIRVR